MHRAILSAAWKSVREHGVEELSIAAVLDRAQLSTRAFYRHFESKDQLVAAVFLDMARVEMLRLRKNGDRRRPGSMRSLHGSTDDSTWPSTNTSTPISATCRSEAQSQMFASPELIQPAYGEMLSPLIEYLRRGPE